MIFYAIKKAITFNELSFLDLLISSSLILTWRKATF
jgi:hypothetical protein